VHDVLHLSRDSKPSGFVTLFLCFTLSAVIPYAAGLSAGTPIIEMGAFHFFWTQALGIAFEEVIRGQLMRFRGGTQSEKQACLLFRGVGFVWVAAFLTWSGPTWLYPQFFRPARHENASFLPFSIVGYFLAPPGCTYHVTSSGYSVTVCVK